MDSDLLMLHKLVILYILDRLNIAVNNAELTRIILDRNIASFIAIQEALEDLVSDNYIEVKDTRNSHLYSITEEGAETLSYFYNKISVELRDDIDDYLYKEQYHLQDRAASTADYYEASKGEYVVELKVFERGSQLIDINLLVGSSKEADTICNRWKEANADVYEYLMKRLVSGVAPSQTEKNT